MRNNRTLIAFCTLAIAGIWLTGCPVTEDEEGGLGQPCFADGTCNAGLVCNPSSICEQDGGDPSFTTLYGSSSFGSCADCHAPDAPGFTDGTEATQDWSSRASAYQSLQGNASGLIGNFEDCNGVPLIGNAPDSSLIVAVFDETVRANFSVASHPDCNVDSISDMTLKIGGQLTTEELTLLKDWISAGAPDN